MFRNMSTGSEGVMPEPRPAEEHRGVTGKTPTKEECFEAFWDIIADGVIDLHRRGLLMTDDEAEARRRELGL